MLTMPLNPSVQQSLSFAAPGERLSTPSFMAHDIHRSTSHPNQKRTDNQTDWNSSQSSRDTLYAHELLRSFRARHPDSAEGQAACDYCRKRKIKCDRKKPACGHCAQSGRVCTSNDVLRKRGPPSKKERAMMNSAGIVFKPRQASGKGKKDSRSSQYASSSGSGSDSINSSQTADVSLTNRVQPTQIQVTHPSPTGTGAQDGLFAPQMIHDIPTSQQNSIDFSQALSMTDALSEANDWTGMNIQGLPSTTKGLTSAPISAVQSWIDDENYACSMQKDPTFEQRVSHSPSTNMQTSPDCDDDADVCPIFGIVRHYNRPSDAVRVALSAQYEHHFLPPGMAIPESVCVRVLDNTGTVKFIPAHRYTKSTWNESYQHRMIEFPGHKSLSLRQLDDLAHDHHSPFLPGVFTDDDYNKLLQDACRMIRHESFSFLLERSMDRVFGVYPVFQKDTLQTWYRKAKESESSISKSLSQRRHRKALLLLFGAIGSCIGEEIKLDIGGESIPVRAWEFGDQCYRIARGLLTPKHQFTNGDELSLEYVQAVLLMHVYLVVTDVDHMGMLFTLHHSMASGTRMWSEHGSTMETVERELLKRSLWATFTLAIGGQLEHIHDQSWQFPMRAPEGLEAPSPLHGANGDDLSPEMLSTLLSDIRLHAYMAQLLDQRLYQGGASMNDIGTMRNLAIMMRDNLFAWTREAEMIRQRYVNSPTEAACTPLAGKSRKIYDVGAKLLMHFIQYTSSTTQ
ncbi:hypothetical protein MCUN1_001392 [Malassezia cuniculi]|uniref:Zn(2)-C6 fungal-type domain-containing protein n=1 Tax=Malassezia cuniculi TaxID=948313 RepID=A0AAF0EQ65_9BASI|nr:hypothetical protein MCUN1_001392 [Malassezia cuniculi]